MKWELINKWLTSEDINLMYHSLCLWVSYHFERGQYQDDIADLAAVLPPVLWPLQAGDAHMTFLEMLHVAAGAQREKKEVL